MSSILLLLAFINCGSVVTKEIIQPMEKVNIVEAVKSNNLSAVERELNQGARVNKVDANNRSLLLLATQGKLLEMATLLVKHGADVNQQDNQQDSPFLYAGATGQTELLKVFLANGACFDVYNRYGGTALIPAAERAHLETVKLLANTSGFPVNHINRLGWTALMEAVILGDGSKRYVEVIEVLLKAGADRNIPDYDGVTPLAYAKKKKFHEIIKVLESKP